MYLLNLKARFFSSFLKIINFHKITLQMKGMQNMSSWIFYIFGFFIIINTYKRSFVSFLLNSRNFHLGISVPRIKWEAGLTCLFGTTFKFLNITFGFRIGEFDLLKERVKWFIFADGKKLIFFDFLGLKQTDFIFLSYRYLYCLGEDSFFI